MRSGSPSWLVVSLVVALATPGPSLASGAPATPSLTVAPPAVPPAPPLGYFVDRAESLLPAPSDRDQNKGDYTWSIERIAPDAAALRLLAIAEATYPPRDLLARLADEEGYEIGSDTVRVSLWWCEGTGPRRVPYAVTRGALDYYVKLTGRYRDHERREPGTQPLFSCDVRYRAAISRRDEFTIEDRTWRDVYVASLGLTWTFDDGTFLPVVVARRTVVLTPAGAIVAVDGDGGAIENLSISPHRGVGRQRQLIR